jgi:hypothetical protein
MRVLKLMELLEKVLFLLEFVVLDLEFGSELVELGSLLGELVLERSDIGVVDGNLECFLL